MIYLNGQATAEFVPEIADNLTTDDSTKALSAKQGKVLNEKIEAVPVMKKKTMTRTTDANGYATLSDVTNTNIVSVIITSPIRCIAEIFQNYSAGGMAVVCRARGSNEVLASQDVQLIVYYIDAEDETSS